MTWLFHEKAPEIFMNVKDGDYITKIAYDAHATATHTHELCQLFFKRGLITIAQLEGRTRKVNLTENGKKAKSIIRKIKRIIKEGEDERKKDETNSIPKERPVRTEKDSGDGNGLRGVRETHTEHAGERGQHKSSDGDSTRAV